MGCKAQMREKQKFKEQCCLVEYDYKSGERLGVCL